MLADLSDYCALVLANERNVWVLWPCPQFRGRRPTCTCLPVRSADWHTVSMTSPGPSIYSQLTSLLYNFHRQSVLSTPTIMLANTGLPSLTCWIQTLLQKFTSSSLQQFPGVPELDLQHLLSWIMKDIIIICQTHILLPLIMQRDRNYRSGSLRVLNLVFLVRIFIG